MDLALTEYDRDRQRALDRTRRRATGFLAFATLVFASTSFVQLDEATYRVTGDLSIKGVTKSIAIDFEVNGTSVDPYGYERLGFEGTTVINRKDWGVNFNAALDTGGVLVSDKITLEFDVSAIRLADS